MTSQLDEIINLHKHPITNEDFQVQCKEIIDQTGVLVLDNFLNESAIKSIQSDAKNNKHLAYYTTKNHNIYLDTPDSNFSDAHPRNREVSSSKGCITTDQVPNESALKSLYDAQDFKSFLCAVLNEKQLFEYGDTLSSINIHYASEGQELGWHFDNSSFAITLLIDKPKAGGVFEYVKDVRDADAGDMNYETAGQVLDGKVATSELDMNPGTLVLFRGRNSMHRVTPTQGDRTRMLAVLAYNSEPNISLSEPARMTFFGRLE